MPQPASLKTWAIWLSGFAALLVMLREQIPPSTAVSLVMMVPTWILTEGFAETLDRLSLLGPRWAFVDVLRPTVLRLAPIGVAVVLCAVPGLTDWVAADLLGYEGRRWTSGPGQGVGVGLSALGLHALGLRAALEQAVRGLLPSRPDLPK